MQGRWNAGRRVPQRLSDATKIPQARDLQQSFIYQRTHTRWRGERMGQMWEKKVRPQQGRGPLEESKGALDYIPTPSRRRDLRPPRARGYLPGCTRHISRDEDAAARCSPARQCRSYGSHCVCAWAPSTAAGDFPDWRRRLWVERCGFPHSMARKLSHEPGTRGMPPTSIALSELLSIEEGAELKMGVRRTRAASKEFGDVRAN